MWKMVRTLSNLDERIFYVISNLDFSDRSRETVEREISQVFGRLQKIEYSERARKSERDGG